MTVADCHSAAKLHIDRAIEAGLSKSGLSKNRPDVILFLGDNSADDIANVREWLASCHINAPCYGIVGNHEGIGTLEYAGIENLHMGTVRINGLIVCGFGGTVRYKDESNLLMFTQDECSMMMRGLPPCDILITHSNPQFPQYYADDELPQPTKRKLLNLLKHKEEPPQEQPKRQKPVCSNVHSGLVGIAEYIDRTPIRHFFCGHLHARTTEVRDGKTLHCCYGIELHTV